MFSSFWLGEVMHFAAREKKSENKFLNAIKKTSETSLNIFTSEAKQTGDQMICRATKNYCCHWVS